MRRILRAYSLAPAARDWLRSTGVARVLHVFDRACNLIDSRGGVLSLVAPEVGSGPFAIIVPIENPFRQWVDADSAVTFHASLLSVGHMSVDVAGAVLWSPRPRWAQAQARLIDGRSFVTNPARLLESCLPGDSSLVRDLGFDAQIGNKAIGYLQGSAANPEQVLKRFNVPRG